jgi:hypothetical protein
MPDEGDKGFEMAYKKGDKVLYDSGRRGWVEATVLGIEKDGRYFIEYQSNSFQKGQVIAPASLIMDKQ